MTYPFSRVGTDAFTSNSTTTVPTVVIPFRLVFSDGSVTDGSEDVALLKQSPIFGDYTYKLSGGDVTQYGDAIQRAQFNRIGSSYHVLLGQPTVLPTLTISVPANQGSSFVGGNGLVGLMNYSWFNAQLGNALNTYNVDPRSFPMILVHNTFLYQGDVCCFLGYHGASGSRNGNGTQSVQTYMFGSMINPGTFVNFDRPGYGLGDIHAISHEVSEWYADPFVDNAVTPWLTPTAPQYGCTGLLETGDPVVGYWFPLAGNPQPGSNRVWHPEDEVYLSWFARQVPSIAYKGKYTYMGTFTEPASGCS